MKAASELEPAGSLRPHTYTTLIGLLASCGLRPGEAVRLRDTDVELETAPPRVVIRGTKFHRSRLVPVDSSAADAWRNYAAARKRLGYDGLAQTFFASESGAPLAYSTVGARFLRIVRGLGIHGPDHSFGPNLRCLRHTFVVRRLLHWYRQGMDVNKLLPHLSIYLGHAKPQNTYWYLTATPELLREAASRFESFAGQGGELLGVIASHRAVPRELFAVARLHLKPLPAWIPEVYRLYQRLIGSAGMDRPPWRGSRNQG
jgi:integrase